MQWSITAPHHLVIPKLHKTVMTANARMTRLQWLCFGPLERHPHQFLTHAAWLSSLQLGLASLKQAKSA